MSRIKSRFLILFSTLIRHNMIRPWEALLVLLTMLIAYCGTTSIFVLNYSAMDTVSDAERPYPSWQITANLPNLTVSKSEYAALRRLGFRNAIAYSLKQYELTAMPADGDSNEKEALRILALDQMSAWQAGLTLDEDVNVTPPPNTNSTDRIHGLITSDTEATAISYLAPTNATVTFQQVKALPFDNADVLMDLADYYTYFESSLTGIYLLGELTPTQQYNIEQWLPDHLRLSPVNIIDSPSAMSKSLKINLWAMTAMMVIVCGFVVINAINLSLRARLGMLTTLRQLGVGFKAIRKGLIVEYFTLNLIAATLGVPLGLYLTSLLSNDIVVMLERLLSHPLATDDVSIGLIWFMALGIGSLMLVLMLWGPLTTVKNNLTHAKRHTSGAKEPWLYLLTLAALVFSLVLLAMPMSLVNGLLLLGGVLIFGSGMLFIVFPFILALLNRPSLARFPVLHWSVSNTGSLAKRTKLATCAFFIALTSNVGMNVMVDSFRSATQDWLTQRIASPAYLFYDPQADVDWQAHTGMFLRYRTTGYVNNTQVSIRGFHLDKESVAALDMQDFIKDAADKLKQQKGILVNQQLSIRHGIIPGDSVTLFIDGNKTTQTVLGIYPDYGNPSSQVMVPSQWIEQFATPDPVYSVVDEAAMAYAESLANRYPDDTRLDTRDEIIHYSMTIFDNTFFITDKLNIVTSAVAALALGLAMLLITFDLRPQLALLKVMGIGLTKLRLAILGQYALIGLVSVALAIPFGYALSYILVNYVNVAAFQWHYPLIFDLDKVAQVLLFSFITVLVLLLIPLQNIRFHSQGRTQQLW